MHLINADHSITFLSACESPDRIPSIRFEFVISLSYKKPSYRVFWSDGRERMKVLRQSSKLETASFVSKL